MNRAVPFKRDRKAARSRCRSGDRVKKPDKLIKAVFQPEDGGTVRDDRIHRAQVVVVHPAVLRRRHLECVNPVRERGGLRNGQQLVAQEMELGNETLDRVAHHGKDDIEEITWKQAFERMLINMLGRCRIPLGILRQAEIRLIHEGEGTKPVFQIDFDGGSPTFWNMGKIDQLSVRPKNRHVYVPGSVDWQGDQAAKDRRHRSARRSLARVFAYQCRPEKSNATIEIGGRYIHRDGPRRIDDARGRGIQ